MTFDEYQLKAAATDASEIAKNTDLSVPLLGLAGETGSLLTLYKKWLRDGDAYQIMADRLSEEMGDILWYLAAIARRRGLSSIPSQDRILRRRPGDTRRRNTICSMTIGQTMTAYPGHLLQSCKM